MILPHNCCWSWSVGSLLTCATGVLHLPFERLLMAVIPSYCWDLLRDWSLITNLIGFPTWNTLRKICMAPLLMIYTYSGDRSCSGVLSWLCSKQMNSPWVTAWPLQGYPRRGSLRDRFGFSSGRCRVAPGPLIWVHSGPSPGHCVTFWAFEVQPLTPPARYGGQSRATYLPCPLKAIQYAHKTLPFRGKCNTHKRYAWTLGKTWVDH